MNITRLQPDIWVGPQITIADIETLAARGIRSIICNRPDNEVPGQPAAASIEAAVKAQGLHFAHVPVISSALSGQDVATFGQALADLPGPVLVYCRSGMRSAMLWALASAGRLAPDTILAATAGAGFNLDGLRPSLESLAARGGAH